MQETDTRLVLTALNPAYSSLMYHHSKEMSHGLHHDWNHNIHDSHGRLFIQSTKIKIKRRGKNLTRNLFHSPQDG